MNYTCSCTFNTFLYLEFEGYLFFLLLLYDLCSRDITTGQPEVMVNFVSSSYKPDLLKFLVDKASAFPEVVRSHFIYIFFLMNVLLFLNCPIS